MDSKGYSMKKAIIINAGSKYTQVIVQLLINVILARLLNPEAYGIVAVVTVFVSFFNVLADMGFGSAIIQNKTLSRYDVESIFSFTCYLGIVLAVAFSCLSSIIATIYDNKVYTTIGGFLAISVFFNTLNMVPKAELMKEKKFFMVAMRTIISSIGAGIIAIALACKGWEYYALVFQTVTSSLLMFLWNYINVRLKFRFKIDRESIRKVIGFSTYQFGFSMINYFSRNLDNLIVGKAFGEAELGIYSKSYQLMTYPINNLTSVITPALQPILSDYQDQKEVIYKKYIEIFSLLAVIGSFVAVYFFFAPQEIILILYGNKWISAIPYFRILSLSIFAQIVYVSAPSIFLSLGNSRLLFSTSVLNTLMTIVGICVGLLYKNMQIMTIGITVAYNIIALNTFYNLVKKGFEKKFLEFIRKIAVFLLIYIVLIFVSLIFPFEIRNMWLSAVAKGIYLGIPYIVLLLLTKTYKLYFVLFIRRKK